MLNTNFPLKTKINLTNWLDFNKEIASIPLKNNVTNWTAKGLVKGNDLYTTGLEDCTSCIIADGEGRCVHIRPTDEENNDFSEIEKKLLKNVNLRSPQIKGFLIGSVSFYQKSRNLFENFIKLLENKNIPYSMMRGHTKESIKSAIAYKAEKNTIFVTNDFISDNTFFKKPPNSFLLRAFEEIKINPNHEFNVGDYSGLNIDTTNLSLK